VVLSLGAEMRRRDFIKGIAGSAAAWPLAVRAQEPGRNYRIGFLTGNPREAAPHIAFFDELRMSGFIDGQNLAVIAGGFGVRNEQVSAAAAAIVQSAPDAIVSAGPVATRAAQAATKTIPILATSDDMVGGGLVPSLRRPGGNTTGVSLLAPELDGKRQDILIEAVPGIRRIAALADPNVSTPQHLEALKDAARARGGAFGIFRPHARGDCASHERGERFGSPGNQRSGNTVVLLQPPHGDRGRCSNAAARYVSVARNGGRRRLRGLWATYHSMVPSIGTAACPSPARCQAGRSSRRAADKI